MRLGTQQPFPLALFMMVAAVATVLLTNQMSLLVVNSGAAVEFAERNRTLVWVVGTVGFIFFSAVGVGAFASAIAALLRFSPAEQRKIFWGFTFAAPWIVGFVIFVLGPAIASFLYSFTDYKLGEEASWVGLENYRTLLLGTGAHGRRFSQAMYNSFYYALLGVPLQIITALIMALLLNSALRGMRLFRLIFYIPVILAGGPAILLAWRYMLASNGGFINGAMQGLAQNFAPFDLVYRFFIFSVEGFNGFYAGVTRGDPMGALVYTIPAVIGFVVLLTLVRGDWTPSKRARAWQAAEIIGIVVIVILFANAIILEPVPPTLILLIGAIALLLIAVALARGRVRQARIGQVVALIGNVVALLFILVSDVPDKTPYLIALAVVGIPPLLLFAPMATRAKLALLVAGITVACLGMLLTVAPSQFGTGGAGAIPRYLALSSAIEDPTNLDYLETTFPLQLPSPLWVWGAVAVVLVGVAGLRQSAPRAGRILTIAALLVFGLLTIGSFLDTVRYFNAYDQIAVANGSPNYHFALFRQATAEFPTNERVPLWLSSELWSKPSLILITVWSSGAGMLIFLAALKGVPQTLYEAAEVDGANRLQRFFNITLPTITPALFYNIVIGTIAALQTFESIYIIQTQQTQDSLMSAAYFLYVRTFRQLAIGEGSAVSWTLAAIIILLTAFQFRYSRWVNYEA